MTYRLPTLPEQQLLRRASLPVDPEIRYYIDPTEWRHTDFELEWVRNEQELLRNSFYSDSGPEYVDSKVSESEDGDLDELAARIDALLDGESERFEDTLIEVTVSLPALQQFVADLTAPVAA